MSEPPSASEPPGSSQPVEPTRSHSQRFRCRQPKARAIRISTDTPHPHPRFSTECNVQPGWRTAVCESAAEQLVTCLDGSSSGWSAAAAPSGPGVLAAGRGREPGTAPPAGHGTDGPAVRLVGWGQCQQQGHPSVSVGFPSRGAALLQIQALGGVRWPMHVCCTGLYLRVSDFSNLCDGGINYLLACVNFENNF